MSRLYLTAKSIVFLVLFRVVKMTVKSSQNAPVCTFGSTVKRQLTNVDLYSNFPLKCSDNRRVKYIIVIPLCIICILDFNFLKHSSTAVN